MIRRLTDSAMISSRALYSASLGELRRGLKRTYLGGKQAGKECEECEECEEGEEGEEGERM